MACELSFSRPTVLCFNFLPWYGKTWWIFTPPHPWSLNETQTQLKIKTKCQKSPRGTLIRLQRFKFLFVHTDFQREQFWTFPCSRFCRRLSYRNLRSPTSHRLRFRRRWRRHRRRLHDAFVADESAFCKADCQLYQTFLTLSLMRWLSKLVFDKFLWKNIWRKGQKLPPTALHFTGTGPTTKLPHKYYTHLKKLARSKQSLFFSALRFSF